MSAHLRALLTPDSAALRRLDELSAQLRRDTRLSPQEQRALLYNSNGTRVYGPEIIDAQAISKASSAIYENKALPTIRHENRVSPPIVQHDNEVSLPVVQRKKNKTKKMLKEIKEAIFLIREDVREMRKDIDEIFDLLSKNNIEIVPEDDSEFDSLVSVGEALLANIEK